MRLARPAVLVSLLGAALLAVSVESAAAWQCTARSRTATGWAVAPSRSAAAYRALRECAVRTPRGALCRISRCRR